MSAPAATVVLVHGLWMRGIVFALLRRRLARAGFDVRTWSYPSVCRGLDANVAAFARFVAALEAERIDLVGHSLGGVVVANLAARHPDPRLRRLVLMGAPWRGAHCAGRLLRVPVAAWLVGRSLRDWLAMAPPELPDGVDIGVIAGTRAIGLAGALTRLPPPSDGIVGVDETRLDGARDAITLNVSHIGMLFSRPCAAQVAAFLRDGRFDRTGGSVGKP